MPTFLFDSIVFGPVWSRRLGESLGINLLPLNRKTCNYNCIYCECGLTPEGSLQQKGFPLREDVYQSLKMKLADMKSSGQYLDSITFAGNGEPTLHPSFALILGDVIELRNEFYPRASVSVLSNATMIYDEKIFNALLQADRNILKLDSAIDDTLAGINCPAVRVSVPELVERMKAFGGKLTVQTLFFRGIYRGRPVDNTSGRELDAWIQALKKIKPENVMIYTLARDTAVEGLEPVSPDELKSISIRAEDAGISTQVST